MGSQKVAEERTRNEDEPVQQSFKTWQSRDKNVKKGLFKVK
jgi:hypothetical protein